MREAFAQRGADGEGIVEQIDGAIEFDSTLYLVEMKWLHKTIERQGIAPHLVSVYGRGYLGGIFISYSGFSSAAIEDASTGLSQKVFVFPEIQTIAQTLECESDLKTFFKEKIFQAKSDHNPFHKL